MKTRSSAADEAKVLNRLDTNPTQTSIALIT